MFASLTVSLRRRRAGGSVRPPAVWWRVVPALASADSATRPTSVAPPAMRHYGTPPPLRSSGVQRSACRMGRLSARKGPGRPYSGSQRQGTAAGGPDAGRCASTVGGGQRSPPCPETAARSTVGLNELRATPLAATWPLGQPGSQIWRLEFVSRVPHEFTRCRDLNTRSLGLTGVPAGAS